MSAPHEVAVGESLTLKEATAKLRLSERRVSAAEPAPVVL
jgi:hypothetical protein